MGIAGLLAFLRLRIRDLFVGAGDLDTVGFAGLWADLRRRLPRSALRCVLIHADMAAESPAQSSRPTTSAPGLPLWDQVHPGARHRLSFERVGPGMPGRSFRISCSRLEA